MEHYELNYEWNVEKSEKNLEKHGIGLAEACDVWTGPTATLDSSRHGENRKMTLGRIGASVYVVIWEPREGRKRIISARLANDAERGLYERSTNA